MNKKSKGKRRSLMVSATLHSRLKIIALMHEQTLEELVSETLWRMAKKPIPKNEDDWI